QSSHSTFISSIFLLARPPPTSTLFPYTTLFRSELQLPEALFIITKSLLIFDHRLRSLKIVVNAFLGDGSLEDVYAQAAESIDEIMHQLTKSADLRFIWNTDSQMHPVRSNFRPEKFGRAVEQAKEYIRAGD